MRLLLIFLMATAGLAAEFSPRVVNSMVELRSLQPIESKPMVEVLGYYTPGDGGGATYVLTNSVSGTNAYGGKVVALGGTKSWLSLSSIANAREYGAKGDGVTDDRDSIQAAWNDKRGRPVRIPSSLSNYMIGSTLYFTNNPTVDRAMVLYGDGQSDNKSGTVIHPTHWDSPAIIYDGYQLDIHSFTIDYITRPPNTYTNAVGMQFRTAFNGRVHNIGIYDAAKAIWLEPGYSQFSQDFENISVYGYSVGGIHCQGSGSPAVEFRRVDIRNTGYPFSSTGTVSNSDTNVTVLGLNALMGAELRENALIRVSGLSPSEYNGFFTIYAPNGVDGFTYHLGATPSGPVSGTPTVENYTGLSTLEAIRVEIGQQTSWDDIAVEWAGTTRALSFNEWTAINGFHLEGFSGQTGGTVVCRFAFGAEITDMDYVNSSSVPGTSYALFEVPVDRKITLDQLGFRDLLFPAGSGALYTGLGEMNQPFLRQHTSFRHDRNSTPGAEIQTTYSLGTTNSIAQTFKIGTTNTTFRFVPVLGDNSRIFATGRALQVQDNLTGTTNLTLELQRFITPGQSAGVQIFATNTSSSSSFVFNPSISDRSLTFGAATIQAEFNSSSADRLLYLQPESLTQGLIIGTNSGTFNYYLYVPSSTADNSLWFDGNTITAKTASTGVVKTMILNPGENVQIGNNTSGFGLQVSASGSKYRNIRSGTGTLVNGAATVTDGSVLSNSEVFVVRKLKNASTAIGVSFEVTPSAGVSFAITSLKADTTTETGDQSSVNWIMLNK